MIPQFIEFSFKKNKIDCVVQRKHCKRNTILDTTTYYPNIIPALSLHLAIIYSLRALVQRFY